MALETILIDPENNYEILPSAAQLAADFNQNNPNVEPVSEQDINDLNEILVGAGLLEEHFIN